MQVRDELQRIDIITGGGYGHKHAIYVWKCDTCGKEFESSSLHIKRAICESCRLRNKEEQKQRYLEKQHRNFRGILKNAMKDIFDPEGLPTITVDGITYVSKQIIVDRIKELTD